MSKSLILKAIVVSCVLLASGAASYGMTLLKAGRAPEIDPGQAIGVLTFLGGSIAVLRSRSKS